LIQLKTQGQRPRSIFIAIVCDGTCRSKENVRTQAGFEPKDTLARVVPAQLLTDDRKIEWASSP
jgi:hypothetical protein